MTLTLDDAVAEIERRFRCVTGLAWRVAQTGEEYVEILSGGIRDDQIRILALCGEEETAVQLWFDAINKYFAQKREAWAQLVAEQGYVIPEPDWTLYWRSPPEMGEHTLYDDEAWITGEQKPHYVAKRFYRVYSRLLISDKPATYADVDAAKAAT